MRLVAPTLPRRPAACAAAGLLAVLAGAAPVSPAAAAVGGGTATSVTMVSETGDYIGGGQARLYHPGNAVVTLSGDAGFVTVTVSGGHLGDAFTLQVAAPPGTGLQVGEYDGAQRASFRAAGRPGLDVFGDGRGCNRVSGRFSVRDVHVTDRRVDRLHVLYEQHCEGGAPALFGEIRVGVPVAEPTGVLVAPGEVAWPSSYPGEPARPVPVTLVNTGTAPVPVGSPAVTGSGAPAFRVVSDQCGGAVPADGACVVYVRFGAVAPGPRSATLTVPVGGATATVRLTGEGEPGVTTWQMRGEPGEWVSGGATFAWTAADAQFRASGGESLVQVDVEAPDGYFTAEFAPGRNDVLLPGVTYTDARRYPFNNGAPGLSVFGSGRGCNRSVGSFTVHEIAFGPRGLERFSASFEMLCDDNPAALVGAVAYRAAAPPPPVPDVEPPAPEVPTFTDTVGTTHEEAIELIAELGIAHGYDDGTFRPAGRVTRGQLASFLDRAFELPAGPAPGFTDTAGSVHHEAIDRLAAAGITSGFADGTFRPDLAVTRDQMASFLDRTLGLPDAPGPAFPDTGGNVHAGAIDRLAAAGVAGGYPDGTFRPRGPVSRGQMASFLARTLVL